MFVISVEFYSGYNEEITLNISRCIMVQGIDICTYIVHTIGTPSQSSASFMACWAFARASFASISSASGHSPGAMASTRAAIAVPSLQHVVKSLISFSGIFDYKE